MRSHDPYILCFLDEMGISLDAELSDITPGLDRPHMATADKGKQKVTVADGDTDDLQARLDNLRRGDD